MAAAVEVSDGARQLAELIRTSRSTVVLTGAGISCPSGIPDFRTPGTGIWENVDPIEVASISAFHADTKRFWEFYRPRFASLGAVEPNPAHQALAELERRGLIGGVITQNIDLLHTKAGSQRVVEVHGSIATCSCVTCGATYAREELDDLFDMGVAECAGCMSKVKPDVVLFGEYLSADAMAEATAMASEAELIICVGSSLEVYPVAGLPELTMAAGGRLALITMGPTPYDADAAVKLEGDVVAELEGVLAALS